MEENRVESLLTNVAVKAALGSLAIIPGCIVFRGKGLRCLCGGLGIGFGAGFGWAQGDLHLRHPDLVPMPQSFSKEMERLKASMTATLSRYTTWFS
mmetsp:Transcript_1750/g.3701  ORF Transcript_1750/g.3701 Transcript_1750/m.3701 type:complete len:96 (+) Transcript_1750:64-351(+)